jgi:hypothetical protein
MARNNYCMKAHLSRLLCVQCFSSISVWLLFEGFGRPGGACVRLLSSTCEAAMLKGYRNCTLRQTSTQMQGSGM